MKLLVCMDNFWLGGRETFLATYLRGLRAHGVEAVLLASRVAAHAAGLDVFTAHVSCDAAADRVATWRSWLERGDALVHRTRPDVVWAQHYELLPAWLLAVRHDLPLVVTFHGPLAGVARPNPPMEAIGMALAVSRGDMVTAVSPETVRSIEQPSRMIPVTPNAVEWSAVPRSRNRVERVACVTRSSKTGHLRAAARLFARCRHFGTRRLTIAGGLLPGEARRDPGWPFRAADSGRLLGFQWALGQGLAFAGTLARIKVVGPVRDSAEIFENSDAAFGMGRVVLEALAAGLPAVLVGYEEPIDVIDGTNFDLFAEQNFSGRGQSARPVAEIAARLADPRSLRPLAPEQVSRFSIAEQAPAIHRLFEGLVKTGRSSRSCRELAETIARAVLDGREEGELFRIACEGMTSEELRMTHRFCVG